MARGAMREQMPVTAWLIDSVRKAWGPAEVDAILRGVIDGAGSVANGNLHARETGPDGVVREFGQPVKYTSKRGR